MGRPIDVELKNITKEFVARGHLVRAVDRVSLQIADGEFFALLGPSGCGKTTTLRLIAGFEQPTSGEILIRGQAMQNVPPFHRPVNTVFQDYALFPHMSVLQNVTFGLEMEGVSGAEARKRALEALEMVRLPQAAERKPRQLSGGQQQRVALARALVKKPAVLLLDEPLGALDLKLRKEMQTELKTMQRQLGITFIFVTHDQEEAMTMADRIAVMDGGHVLQVGTPEEVYESPATRFVADFIGETNFLSGTLESRQDSRGCVRIDAETTFNALLGEEAAHEGRMGQEITVALRPEKLNLFAVDSKVKFPDGTSDSAQEYKTALLKDADINLVEGEVLETVYIGTDTRYTVRIGKDARLVVRMQNFGLRSDVYFERGQRVYVFWDYEASQVLLH
ncbi:MAG: ABC transporter ATP-binding protein [Chloroflexi bacterium]|nr:ABC transporter ATP-binding protein [Chloroflexota bacterium]